MKRTYLVIGAAIVLVGGFLVASLLSTSDPGAQRAEVAAQNPAVFNRMGSPALGPLMARAQVTEFFDPACEGCRAFHPYVKQIMQAHEGKVRLTLRYATFHKGSDYVVKVLEAVRMQGDALYWQALDAILEAQPVWADHGRPQPQRVWEFIGGLGIDLERARRDMDDPRIAALIAQDTADITTLRVNKTPSFFINGQPLREFSPDTLNAQIVEALRS
ncbi:DsbA family protein [Pseudothauera nasutitermitis]|nr:thioredoxin domain-containing protein [Pseudothauera nasutitermitis]